MSDLIRSSGVQLLRSRMLEPYPLVHAFSERSGGVSLTPLDSLNLGNSVGDSVGNVVTNHKLLFDALGILSVDVVNVRQVHGNRVVHVRSSDRATFVGEADGMVTADEQVFMLMRFADCVPVLFYDPHRHAVGIAHAGWRGTAAGVVVETVRALGSEFGSNPRDIIAALGPSIGPCCYQVGPDVVDAISSNAAIPPSVIEFRGTKGMYLNLWRANAAQLRYAGVQRIDTLGLCTSCNSDRFYSHRAGNGHTGRFAAVIGLRGATI